MLSEHLIPYTAFCFKVSDKWLLNLLNWKINCLVKIVNKKYAF